MQLLHVVLRPCPALSALGNANPRDVGCTTAWLLACRPAPLHSRRAATACCSAADGGRQGQGGRRGAGALHGRRLHVRPGSTGHLQLDGAQAGRGPGTQAGTGSMSTSNDDEGWFLGSTTWPSAAAVLCRPGHLSGLAWQHVLQSQASTCAGTRGVDGWQVRVQGGHLQVSACLWGVKRCTVK